MKHSRYHLNSSLPRGSLNFITSFVEFYGLRSEEAFAEPLGEGFGFEPKKALSSSFFFALGSPRDGSRPSAHWVGKKGTTSKASQGMLRRSRGFGEGTGETPKTEVVRILVCDLPLPSFFKKALAKLPGLLRDG